MAFESRFTDDLVRIAAAGGGITIKGGARMTDDLVRIATAAASSGARITFTGMSTRFTDDLVRIGAAGNGNVIFAD